MNNEIVYAQGNNWIWSHKPDSRNLSYQEQLPYWVKTKKQVRDFIEQRCNERRRIKWG